jgi:hypothetical protein
MTSRENGSQDRALPAKRRCGRCPELGLAAEEEEPVQKKPDQTEKVGMDVELYQLDVARRETKGPLVFSANLPEHRVLLASASDGRRRRKPDGAIAGSFHDRPHRGRRDHESKKLP